MRSKKMMRHLKSLACLLILSLSISVMAQRQPPPPPPGGGGGPNQQAAVFDANYQPVASTYEGIGIVTMGEGEAVENLSLTTECTTQERFVSGGSGKVIADDKSEWIVPMAMNEGTGAVDLFNTCTGSGDNPRALDDLETVVIDEDGEVVTAYIFADNYFELYVNGTYVARDTINFIPFNSSVVRFQASYPMTIAVKMADWEEHYGIGMEYESYNVGDGGFIAWFSNGLVTGSDWKVRPLYIAPLDDPACVVEDEFGNANSSGCAVPPQCATSNADKCRALHYEEPEEWMLPDFDASDWADATTYEANEVTNQSAYVDYAKLFGDAEFIWSSSLKLDNYVLARTTIDAPQP
jgi:hypothetical protein